MAKEQKGRFQLNKGEDHKFDISKGSKRKFDLTKDVDEPEIQENLQEEVPTKLQEVIPPTPTPEPENQEKGSQKWWIWLSLIIILALIAWWVWPTSNSDEKGQEETGQEVIAPIEEESVTTSDTALASDTPAEEEEQSETGSTPAPEASNGETPETVATSPKEAVPSVESSPNTNAVSPSSSTPSYGASSSDIETEALKVIRGDYGNNPVRRQQLGDKYQTIQAKVNQLKKEGKF